MARSDKSTPRVPEFGKNTAELARIIGISKTTLMDAMKEDGFPAKTPSGYVVEHVLNFIKQRATKNLWTADMGKKDIVELRKRQLNAQIAKLEHDIAVNRNKYIDREVWKASVVQILAMFDASFQKSLEQELPSQLEGQPAIAIRDQLRVAYNEFKRELNEKFISIGE